MGLFPNPLEISKNFKNHWKTIENARFLMTFPSVFLVFEQAQIQKNGISMILPNFDEINET